MTDTAHHTLHVGARTTLTDLDAAIADVTGRLSGTTARRERDRQLLHEPVRELLDGGFGVLRVPEAAGGLGASLDDLFSRLIAIAAIDPNLAHVFRGHIGFVESLAIADDGDPYVDRWYRRLRDGILVGNAQSERSATADTTTLLTATEDPAVLLLDGRKYYTTGSIYSDWIQLAAVTADGQAHLVLAPASHPGTTIIDDWDGFGQPLTGSGSTTFAQVPVDASDLRPHDDDHGSGEYIAAVFQLTLLAVQAGIGKAALADTLAFVRPRRRLFGRDGATLPREDDIVQVAVGRISALVDAAERLVRSGARQLDLVRETTPGDERTRLLKEAALDVYRLQQVVPKLVLDASTELFEVGGASATGKGFALDRHWRNARTVASHNPALQRQRAIGDYELNGRFPVWGRRPVPGDSSAS
jgi:alkylation response protein AidB-like acyl-CoA dehydrogenase